MQIVNLKFIEKHTDVDKREKFITNTCISVVTLTTIFLNRHRDVKHFKTKEGKEKFKELCRVSKARLESTIILAEAYKDTYKFDDLEEDIKALRRLLERIRVLV